MQKTIIVLIFLSAFTSILIGQNTSQIDANSTKLTKVWTTKAKFESPESVIYNTKSTHIYVSNGVGYAKNGKGFISKLSKTGEVLDLKWVEGLHRPTGMAIFEDQLYVADIDVLRVLDLSNGKQIQTYSVEVENPMLNDVAINRDGQVYVTASGAHSVYLLDDGALTKVFQDDQLLQYANGIVVQEDTITVAGWEIAQMRMDTITQLQLTPALTDFDGLEMNQDGHLFCTQVGTGGKLWQIDTTGKANLIYEQANYLADFDRVEIDGQVWFLIASGNHQDKTYKIIALK